MVTTSEQRQLMESYVDFDPARVERNGQSYAETIEYSTQKLEVLVARYRALEQVNQTARLLRDDIDEALRRYHDYVIAGRIVAHYRQKGCRTKKGNVFEHVIPLRTVRNMLISGIITINQALNAPTCVINRRNNNLLSKHKRTKHTPNAWWFWQRYDVLNIDIETFDGTPVDMSVWDFGEHCKYFNIV
jgi:hypothetical protein